MQFSQSRQTESICENWKAQGLEAIVKKRQGFDRSIFAKISFFTKPCPGIKKVAKGEALLGRWIVTI